MFPEDPDLDPARDSLATASIPAAWIALVQRWDPVLLDLVAQEVMMRTGLWPDAEKIHDFLACLDTPSHLETVRTSETHPGIGGPSIYPPPRQRGAG
ncbi:MAG: hypothetical protein JNJ70_01860 [Verrucomicrobiales bacterium]|nr:hypothetical protein [Verrucomicrobiales bacterium]